MSQPEHSQHDFHDQTAERIRTDGHNASESDTVESRTITLPIEIEEYIIGFLGNENDAGTIANCILVCRRWLPYSQSKLYSLTPLRTRRQLTSFTSLVRKPPANLAGYMRNVRVLYIWPESSGVGWGKDEERPWAHSILTQFSGYLSELTGIDFYYVDWTRAHDYALRIACTYRSLTTLMLNDCIFTSVGQLHKLVAAFPALENLTLDWIKLQSSKPLSIPRGGRQLIRLRLTSVDDDITAVVTQWLIDTRLVENLAHLTWQCDSEDYWKILTEALDAPSLQQLELWVERSWQVDLSRFSSLKVLTLHYFNWSLKDHLKSVIDILASIISTHLEELHIHLSISKTAFLDFILAVLARFRAIDDLLSLPRFASLNHVTLKYDRLDTYIETPHDPSLSPSGESLVSTPGSSSQPDSSDEFVSIQLDFPEVDPRDPQHPFRLYAEPLLLRRIREELKQLATRGILEIEVELRLWPQEVDAGSDEDTQSDGTRPQDWTETRRWMR